MTTVDEYLSTLPPSSRAVIRKVRGHLRRALPKAEEVISYKIPALRTDNGVIIYFAAWKKHYSRYPMTKLVHTKLAKQLAGHDYNDRARFASRSTSRFPRS